MNPVEVVEGNGPIVLGQPHGGVWLPEAVTALMNDRGRAIADTDWHIGRLYDGLLDGVTVVRATFSRYLIDANRDPSGGSLYPGQNTTGLCPSTDFDGHPIYQTGCQPDHQEISERVRAYPASYHAALVRQLDRLRATHSQVLLFDCHSIRSEIPFLFDGLLPAFNVGTNSGLSCAAQYEDAAHRVLGSGEGDGLDLVVNGRFKGGWTTRHYGAPNLGRHAFQLELAQRAYMRESPPWSYDDARAEVARPYLQRLLEAFEQLLEDTT
jgi:N-formylglutamate deformylase